MGHLPRGSTGEAGQAVENDAKDRLVRARGGQVQGDACLQVDDAHGELDEAQPQRVELCRIPPVSAAYWS